MKNISGLISIPFRGFSTVVVCLPLLGLLFSVMWSIIFDFKSSTATHCKVYNFLPSVSASIALTPQAYVWKICIALHCAPRYMAIYFYYVWYLHHSIDVTKWFSSFRVPLIYLTLIGNFVELSALLGLSMVSSSENYAIHEACFILFMVGSLVCMIAACLLNSCIVVETEFEQKVTRLKQRTVAIYIACFLLSLYFFYRHNAYCEPGIYSLFALFEYLVIICNMYFHYFISLDFGEYCLGPFINDDFKYR